MMIYIVRTNYLERDIFGCYRSLDGACNAITRFINAVDGLTYVENYDWTYYATDGSREYYFEILCDILED